MLPYKLPLILLFCSVLSTSANDSGVRRCPEGLLRKILTSFHKRPFKNNERTWEILSKKNLLVSQQEAGKQGMCGPTCSLNAIQVVLARSLGRPFTNPKERLVQIAKRFSEKGTSMLENIEILEELLRPRIPGIEIRGVELEGLHTINPSAPISAISSISEETLMVAENEVIIIYASFLNSKMNEILKHGIVMKSIRAKKITFVEPNFPGRPFMEAIEKEIPSNLNKYDTPFYELESVHHYFASESRSEDSRLRYFMPLGMIKIAWPMP